MNGEQLTTYEQPGIPDNKVAETVKLLQADPRYVSHEVIPEGNGVNTIKVTIRKQASNR